MSPWFSSKKDTLSEVGSRRAEIKEKLEDVERPTMVFEIASPSMLTQSPIENIGLVNQLPGTGGMVDASQQRTKILDMMRRKDANQPNAFLDDKSTALVVATSMVPPAARKGDHLDVLVRLSSHAHAMDLEHGWLMETPLVEMSLLGGEVREGFDLAKAEGYLVTQQQASGDDSPEAKLQGFIVGGARLLKGRDLGIMVDAEFADAITMHAIVPSINQRFTYFDGRKKTGIAIPREASYIEIKVPTKYQLDPYHFINVVLRTSFNETEVQRIDRIATLTRQLNEPTTVREACWQLEAMGEQSITLLSGAIHHPNPEISFYAAHSLAYLNEPSAVPKLKELCLREPAFRAMCLNGLVAIESYEAGDALKELLHAADPEVKYGAVRALRRRDPTAPEVTAQQVGEAGNLLEIPSSGPPLVAVSLNEIPEVVIYGGSPSLHIPAFQYVNPRIIVSPTVDGDLTVSHFSTGKDDQVVTCPADLPSALRAIAEVGGTYGDWVNFVRECHENGYMIEPFALNPVPTSGRTYTRNSVPSADEPGDTMYPNTFIDFADEAAESTSTAHEKAAWNPLTWGR